MDPQAIFDSILKWGRGILLDPNPTAAEYAAANVPWRKTFVELTIPIALTCYVIGLALSFLIGGALWRGMFAAAPFYFLVTLIWGLAFVLVAAFVFDYFGAMVGGVRSFDQSVAMVSLAMIPSFLGGILSAIPFIGWLISLAATIYAAVLLYRFVPMFLIVPEIQRVKHFVIALVTCIVINVLVSGAIAFGMGASVMGAG